MKTKAPACPTPEKVKYRDAIAAKLALANIEHRDSPNRAKMEKRAYRCGGHWHLTSKEKRGG